MLLLTFAHKQEARIFLERQYTLPVDFSFPGLYRGGDELLLITGEGVAATLQKVHTVCEYFGGKLHQVLNLGIAGSLTSDLQVNQIYGIRRIFYEPYLHTAEKTYTSANERAGLDCITAFQAVTTDAYARRLALFAQIVDREVWAHAHICHNFNLPLHAYKLISDRAGSDTNAETIRRRGGEFSKHLFDFYKKLPR